MTFSYVFIKFRFLSKSDFCLKEHPLCCVCVWCSLKVMYIFLFFICWLLFYRYPNTACELLTSDVSQINDKLASDKDLVDQLYSFLMNEGPLNPLLASFFSKVMGLLITRKSEMVCFSFKAS